LNAFYFFFGELGHDSSLIISGTRLSDWFVAARFASAGRKSRNCAADNSCGAPDSCVGHSSLAVALERAAAHASLP
jgi:hypothetical protein